MKPILYSIFCGTLGVLMIFTSKDIAYGYDRDYIRQLSDHQHVLIIIVSSLLLAGMYWTQRKDTK